MSDRSKALQFQTGERVLCYHGPLLYEAKILKTEDQEEDTEKLEPGTHYFVHYKGWKQTWDEWVDDSRLLKWKDENLQKQKSLRQAAILANKKKGSNMSTPELGGGGSSSRKSLASGGSASTGASRLKSTDEVDYQRGRKRGRDASMDKEEEGSKKPEFKIVVPNHLKVKLIDDWEKITKDKLLIPLPRTPNVSQLFEKYYKYITENPEKRRNKKDEKITQEILEGIKLYFDKALGTILLYRFERYQYQQILTKYPGEKMSNIYGAEHLLRLFVQLPVLVSHTNMDEDALGYLKDYLGDLLRFMQKFSDELFIKKYEHPANAYVSVAKSV